MEKVTLLNLKKTKDSRGVFTKIYCEDDLENFIEKMKIKETYYSVSQKNVIRGMHFQLPPHAHKKIVHVIQGEVLDVVVDLRKESTSYQQCFSFHLTADQPQALYIPEGFAHGFKSLKDQTLMLYQVSSCYHADSDTGISYNSIDFDWGISNPILSERDKGFISLLDFVSPF